MRFAICSDIHGNLAAFEAVLQDIDAHGVTTIYSLGDNIGYGPEPSRVLSLLRERGAESVCGNHELGLADPEQAAWFNAHAREALQKTRELLTEDDLSFIKTLPLAMVRHGARMVHGAPPDSALAYLFQFDEHDLAAMFRRLREPLCFVGHTHELEHILWDGERVRRLPLPERLHMDLGGDRKHIVNVGSVGQPRDGDNRAKYILFDPDTGELALRRIPYDIKKTAEAIVAKGLPKRYADRLW